MKLLDFQWASLYMRGSRGGGGGGPGVRTPPEICQRWGLVWIFDGYERGFKGCFYLIFIIFFWLAPLASIQNIVIILKTRNHFQVQRVIPSPVIHTIPGFHEGAISMFILSKITQFYTISTKKFLGEHPQTPPLPCDITCTFYEAKTITSNLFYMEKEKTWDVIFIKSIVYKTVSMAK